MWPRIYAVEREDAVIRSSGAGRIRVLAAAAAAAVSIAVLTGPSAAAEPAPPAAVSPVVSSPPSMASGLPLLKWIPCRDGFQCATAAVPLDYDKPAAAKITLSLIRLPAGSPSRRIGSLFLNPGGPGDSGVDFARFAKFLPLELRARFDIIGFDPRGVARSTPLRCYDTLDQAAADRPPFLFPVTTAEENLQRIADQKLAAACAKHGGPILDHMSTADVARDLDLLRRTVGDTQLNYLGYSYGSMLGQTYANLFPSKVRAMVIDGVLDPIAWTIGRGNEAATEPFSARIGSDIGAQATLGEFFRLCDAAGPDCAFSGSSAQRYAALATRLRQHPVTFTDQELIAVTLGFLSQPSAWPAAAALLADLERQASPQVVGQRVAAIGDRIGARTAVQQPYPNLVEGFPGVACSDSVNPDRFSAWQNTADAAARHGYFGRLETWASSPCLPWPGSAGQDRYLSPWTARTAKPVLVVGNYFDPATPYQGAVTASRLLPNSRLLSYAGWGHTAAFLQSNFCINTAVTDYLVTTHPPAPGTVCQPEGSPFGPSEAGLAGRAADASAAAAAITGPALPEPVRRAFGG